MTERTTLYDWPILMTPGTAAKYLDSNTKNLRLLVISGKLTPVKPYDTQTNMYRKSDLDAFVASLRPA